MRFIDNIDVLLNSIVVGKRLRVLDHDWVEVLAGMIAATGLQNPIEVYKVKGGKFMLMEGEHRLAALRKLNRKKSRVSLWEPETVRPEHEARLHEIAENIGRRELSALDRAINLAEMKRVHEELYPETKRGVAGGKAISKSTNDMLSFVGDAAEKSGLNKRTIERAVALHNGLSKEVIEIIRPLPLADNSAQLTALSKLPNDLQIEVATMLVDPVHVRSVSDAVAAIEGRPSKPSPDGFDGLVKAWGRAVPKEQRRFLKSIGAKPKGGGA